MDGLYVGVIIAIAGAAATGFFTWVGTRGARHRNQQLTNVEQDRLRTNDIIEQQRTEIQRLVVRAERAERKTDDAERRLDRANDKVDALEGELDFAHSEIRRLGGPSTANT